MCPPGSKPKQLSYSLKMSLTCPVVTTDLKDIETKLTDAYKTKLSGKYV